MQVQNRIAVREAAHILGVSEGTVRRWSRIGLENFPILRRISPRKAYFDAMELRKFAEGRPANSKEAAHA